MKKLLITVIGAAAALGASAGLISTQRFENASVNTISIATLNTLAGGTYWSGDEQTNKYTVTTAGSIACPRQSLFGVAPSNALKIETTFGKPLNVNAVAGGDSTNINSSVFFDSLVKFTVCDSAPTQEYADAKIVMWLQETEADGQVQAKTNLMVKAGYLYVEGGVLTSRDKDYTCDLPQNFDCDAWHRVTIKAIANITKSQTPVPGFAIHIDGDDATGTSAIVLSDDDKWDESFTQKYEFADAVRNLTRDNALFPSIDQTSGDKVALRSVGFDGTGSITDLIFTEDAPSFAEDYVPSEPVVVIDGQEYTSLEVAVQAINASATAATFKLASDLSLAAPIEFNNQTAAITLDFAGHVITNTLSDAIITNNAVNLIITNSTETVGGINCLSTGAAIYQAAGALAITAGNFWGENLENGAVLVAEGYSGNTKFISGGAFASNMGQEAEYLVDGKTFADQANTDGLYPVIDAITVTYTVTFVYGKPDGSYTQQFQVVENVTPTAPDASTVAVDGWTFNGWDTTVVAATADATYTAQYTLASWVGLLGQPVNGAYVIKNLDDLVLFKNGVAQLGTSGETFRLAADIDAGSLGYWDGIGTASGTIDSSATSKKGLNNCTFDGAGHTISNVKFTNAKYRGFFNQVLNSTIKDLTINVVDIAQPASASSEHGYSAFAGNMKNSKIQSCTATGTIGTVAKPAMHTCGGFAVKSDGGNVFENCTNYVDIVCSLTDNPKIGGIFGLGQTGSSALTNCWNFGDITITCKTCDAAANGAGGLVGYSQSNLTISGGGNAGTVQSTDTTAATGTAAVKAGAIIGMQTGSGMTATVSDGTVAQADAMSAGAIAQINGLSFATVDGNVATFVDTLAASNTYKVMAADATATYAFTAAGTISFDTALATPTYAITAAEGLTLTDKTVGTVKTYTAAAPAADWDPNPDEIAENETAAQAYPALGDTPLASANAKKLTKWAKANSVTFETASEATTATVEAFLLNCAPADVETAKEAFKLDITIENGVPQVSLPEGAAYNVEPKMKGSNNLSTWTDTETTAGYQFFKYVLEL